MTHHHRIEQAEREAEAARASLERSLDELRGRLTPGRMLDETLSYARNNGGGEFVKNFSRQVRGNPLPVALVGAGLAWLMLARRDHADRHTYEGGLGEAAESGGLTGQMSDAASGLSEAVSSAGDRVSSAYDTMAGTASAATKRLRRGKNDAFDRVSRLGRTTSEKATHLAETQPVLLGALGLVLGAVLGSVIPGTRTEDRIAGTASDDFKTEAKDALREQADKAVHVAERAYEGAYKEAERAATEEGWVEPSAEKSTETKPMDATTSQGGA